MEYFVDWVSKKKSGELAFKYRRINVDLHLGMFLWYLAMTVYSLALSSLSLITPVLVVLIHLS